MCKPYKAHVKAVLTKWWQKMWYNIKKIEDWQTYHVLKQHCYHQSRG